MKLVRSLQFGISITFVGMALALWASPALAGEEKLPVNPTLSRAEKIVEQNLKVDIVLRRVAKILERHYHPAKVSVAVELLDALVGLVGSNADRSQDEIVQGLEELASRAAEYKKQLKELGCWYSIKEEELLKSLSEASVDHEEVKKVLESFFKGDLYIYGAGLKVGLGFVASIEGGLGAGIQYNAIGRARPFTCLIGGFKLVLMGADAMVTVFKGPAPEGYFCVPKIGGGLGVGFEHDLNAKEGQNMVNIGASSLYFPLFPDHGGLKPLGVQRIAKMPLPISTLNFELFRKNLGIQ